MASRVEPGAVIQFGSGHPGEEGSGRFEAKLFGELDLDDPNVLFLPFHHMPPRAGDLALFKRIYGAQTRGWIRSFQLLPPRWPQNAAELFSLVEDAQVIVLGSGFPEPFIELLRRLGLHERFKTLHARGTHFIGYSAGTLSLSEGYYLPFTGEDLLHQLDLLDQVSIDDEQREDLQRQMASALERPDAKSFIESIRAARMEDEELDEDQREFLAKTLWMEQARGFKLTPGLTVNPHFGETFQYRAVHLEILGELFPDWVHVGVPNGCALVTRHLDGERLVTFRGRNPRRRAGYRVGTGRFVELGDGDPIPY